MTECTYDPKKHDGILYTGTEDFIIEDSAKAALHELPQNLREEIKKQTTLQVILLEAGNNGGILQNTDPAYADVLADGFRKGIALLKLDE